MAFLLYERRSENGLVTLRRTGDNFQLAGRNLVFRAWENQGRPLDRGWHVSADELIGLHTNGAENYQTRRLIIDFHPRSLRRIGLIELLDIYAYTTHEDDPPPDDNFWTPMMLRLRDVFYGVYSNDITPEQKREITGNLPEPEGADDFVEFLYLVGSAWCWGKNGTTNAVFLHKPMRDYFRAYF